MNCPDCDLVFGKCESCESIEAWRQVRKLQCELNAWKARAMRAEACLAMPRYLSIEREAFQRECNAILKAAKESGE